jgi:hypothetical protein
MLSIALMLVSTGGLVQFLIAVVVIGAILYCVQLLPINDVFKKVALVVGCVVLFILAIKILLPLVGV